MATITVTRIKAYEELTLADYISDEQETYEICYTLKYNNSNHRETRILHYIYKGCAEFSEDDSIWKEVEQTLNKQSKKSP